MVAVGDTSKDSRYRFREVGCHRGETASVRTCDRAPRKVPSDLERNVGGPPNGLLDWIEEVGGSP